MCAHVPVEGVLLFLLVGSPCLSPSTDPLSVMPPLTACATELNDETTCPHTHNPLLLFRVVF